MLAVAAILAGIIGILLGLLGGGGSILTLPMLVYVVKLDPKEAIASSLFVVGTTSIVGVIAHARAGRVVWRVGALFGVAGMAGAYLGGRLAHYVPSTVLLVMFAAMMLLTSMAMLRGRKQGSTETRDVAIGKALILGFFVGSISGLVGAGGGFLVVPALSILGGLPMPRAVATSLLVITMQSLSGFMGHVAHVSLHWPLLLLVTSVSIAGSLLGARLAKRANPDTLRKSFGWLVLAMGVFLLGKQLPGGPLRDVGMPLAVLAVVVVAAVFLVRDARSKKTLATDSLTP
jgi:uncharacterized membrane protein YfcA